MNSKQLLLIRCLRVAVFLILIHGWADWAESVTFVGTGHALAQTERFGEGANNQIVIRGRVQLSAVADQAELFVQAVRGDGVVAELTPVNKRGWFVFPSLPNTGYGLRVVTISGYELPLLPQSQTEVAPGSPAREYLLLIAAGNRAEVDRDAQNTSPESVNQLDTTNRPEIADTMADETLLSSAPQPLDLAPDAPSAATFRGRVTSAIDGQPLGNVGIFLLSLSTGSAVNSTQTGKDGNYTLAVFAAGAYKIKFEPSSFFTPGYLPEFYNNKPTLQSADPLTVADNAALTGIDAALERSGRITGRVTSAVTSQPISSLNVSVRAYMAPTATTFIQSAVPNAQGVYTLTNLTPGAYHLEFASFTYVPEFYNKQRRLLDATPISVTTNATVTDIDAVMDSRGALAGSVADAVTGATIPNATVTLYRQQDRRFVANTETDTTGRYTLPALLPEVYLLQVTGVAGYLEQYYNKQRTPAAATPITITLNVTTQVDIALDKESLIRGRVTDAETGAPVPNVTVRAASLITNILDEFAQTDATGAYTITALWSGAYTVTFTPPSTTEYMAEYYNNKGAAALADAVNVPANGVINGIDATLEKLGRLTGRVTGADNGASLPGVTVTLYRLDNCAQRDYIGTQETDANGDYRFTRLQAGIYRVRFEPGFRATPAVKRYLGQYYNNQPDEPGDDITVALNATTANINAALQLGGLIRGRVTAADTGLPLDDVYVTFYQKQGNLWDYVDSENTDANGDYVSPALPPGSYRVDFEPSSFGQSKDYVEEYYNNKPTWSSTDEVPVAAGAEQTGINAALDRGGLITGVVKDAATGQPLDDVWADVYRADSKSYFTYGSTDSRGVYTTGALATGTYLIQFEPSNSGKAYSYTVSYYNNKPDVNSADRVNVTATQITPNINGFLTIGGAIHGRVTAANSGLPIADVAVWGRKIDGTEGRFTRTDESGHYKLEGLAAGNYKVLFYSADYSDYCGRIDYSELYYSQKPTFETADPVSVTVPNITPNINGILPVKAVIGNPQPGDQLSARVYLPLVRR